MSSEMEKWSGKVAIVTGVGSGIGKGVTEAFMEKGLTVVGIDKRNERLSDLENSFRDKSGKFFPIQADLLKEDEIISAFEWVDKNLGGVHILVSNAGVLNVASLLKVEDSSKMKDEFGVNVLGALTCLRLGIKLMLKHKIDNGQIIQIGSVSAHLSLPILGLCSYMASNKATLCLSDGLRNELAGLKSNIKLTMISPGVVYTEMTNFGGVAKPEDIVCLKVADVVRAVLFILEQPPDVLVEDIIIRNIKENRQRVETSLMDYVKANLMNPHS